MKTDDVIVSFRGVRKTYDGETLVVKNLNLDIDQGEFLTMLGPSGSGKTTCLMMLAGFETATHGDIILDGNPINNVAPHKRHIGMVFQNYAIFPHYTVRQNVEFGLKNRKLPKDEIKKTTTEFLELMRMLEFKDRMPELLSGGQQQRVALARALVIKPDVLLMDEPLSNLDAKLRLEMRQVIRDLQKEVGITTIYVTHDQEEAMAISDRIAVMKDGVIQHVGTPPEIYHRPSNIFVATFIGRTNLVDAEYSSKSKVVRMDGYEFEMDNLDCETDCSVVLSIRPEDFQMSKDTTRGIKSTISDNIFLGLNTHFHVELPNKQTIEIIHESVMDSSFKTGDTVYLNIKTEKINVFTKDGNRNLIRAA